MEQLEAELLLELEGQNVSRALLIQCVSRVGEVVDEQGVESRVLVRQHEQLSANVPIGLRGAYVDSQISLDHMCQLVEEKK